MDHTAVAVGSAIYVIGGFDGGGIASVLKFDSAQDTWSEVAPVPDVEFYAFAACAVGSDNFVFGGQVRGGQTGDRLQV
jgi:hypothetical protein